jgi:AcrR family transcriptional regulator
MLATGNIKHRAALLRLPRARRGGGGRRRFLNVEEIQRSRVLAAMAEEVALRGAASVTVARVIARARVSRRLFYEQFADVEDCLLATFDWAVDQARGVVLDACRDQEDWLERMRIGLAVLLRFFDAQPLLAQLCIVQAAGGGRRVLERRSAVIAELSTAVDEGRRLVSGNGAPSALVAEGVVGAVLAVLYGRVLTSDAGAGGVYPGARGAGADAERGVGIAKRAGAAFGAAGANARGAGIAGAGELIELHGELMSMIVLPYLGSETSAKEIGRRPPPAPRSLAAVATPIAVPASEQAGARLTYRTVRVLRAIAELPAASNREIAERAGVVDQGQISKILTRLEYQGLVVNRGGNGPARGAPNSWWLTERGEALERDLRERPPMNESGPERGDSSGSRRHA